ncbi:AMP-binding protein [Nocardia sp. CDC159]|uniref:AMP-binding protein n=1 Tax=Nocardia pulmonis TaxID=2951408 RepID=A0A9X2IZJ2_9NOCA|nr:MULTISPECIES: AMP-binding protein [Nocardia]MCM6777563.1 AMP-binding protein [Nocardia pulmonis]MCM6790330.1 AMP-binding protein [Nocardia sp. CDC159]
MSAEMLPAAIRRWALERPDAPAVIALSHRGEERSVEVLTYRELDCAASALAALIRTATAPGDRVAVACEYGFDHVVAFLACLYSGRTAVPLAAPTRPRAADRLGAALVRVRPTLALLSRGAAGGVADGVRVLTVSIDRSAPPISPDATVRDPAYLQYDSDALVDPGQLAAALDRLRAHFPVVAERPVVSWLPPHHCVGLVFALSLPLYCGVPAITLPPAEFVARPIRWLRACSDFHAGATASPNAGLGLAVSATTPAERAGLELSGLAVLLGCAEPVRAEPLSAFTRAFAPYGFRHAAHTPTYTTPAMPLPVTCAAPADDPVCEEFDRTELTAGRAVPRRDGLALVGCGEPLGRAVRIVDPIAHEDVATGRVGEIWVADPSGRAENWLRTGDLGFRHDGQLYPTGRLPGLLRIDGRTHYPGDIEATVAEASGPLRPGRIAAFTHDENSLIVVAEFDDGTADPAQAVTHIRAAIADRHGITPADIVLVPPGSLPRTSDAPRRRAESRARYRDGRLPRLTTERPST